MPSIRPFLAAIGLVVAAAACSGGGAAASVSPPPEADLTITARQGEFEPVGTVVVEG